MNKLSLLIVLFLLTPAALYSQAQDADGCKEHPMFPNRMSNYILNSCANNYDAADFNVAAGGAKVINKEGTKTLLRYDFNGESAQSKPSCLQILRNYEAAAKKIGATTLFLSAAEGTCAFKIVKSGKEVAWIKVETGGNDNSDFYELTILELQDMKQEIASTDMLTALNTDGHIALYINFESGKSDIQPESQKIIDEISKMLADNPTLKISVEGHTDNSGAPASNKALSERRAAAVVSSLVAGGTVAARLSSKGWGQDKPIADNSDEDGKAKNRRVEIVKL